MLGQGLADARCQACFFVDVQSRGLREGLDLSGDPLMTAAIEKSHRRTVDARIAPADGKVPPLDETLRILSEKVVRGL